MKADVPVNIALNHEEPVEPRDDPPTSSHMVLLTRAGLTLPVLAKGNPPPLPGLLPAQLLHASYREDKEHDAKFLPGLQQFQPSAQDTSSVRLQPSELLKVGKTYSR